MNFFKLLTQILIPVLTISGQIALAFKLPQWALLLTLIAQPFWIYSSWIAFKDAKQIGMFINSLIFAAVTLFGFLNYWFL
jgi:hypothetical protein